MTLRVRETRALRGGTTPPGLGVHGDGVVRGGQTEDLQTTDQGPSVLLKPTWVTVSNMNSTVIVDQFVPAQRLCVGQYAAGCRTAGISV